MCKYNETWTSRRTRECAYMYHVCTPLYRGILQYCSTHMLTLGVGIVIIIATLFAVWLKCFVWAAKQINKPSYQPLSLTYRYLSENPNCNPNPNPKPHSPYRCILDGFKAPGQLACYAPLSGLNAPFLCHSAVIAHSPAPFYTSRGPPPNCPRSFRVLQSPSWSVIHYLHVFLLLFLCLVCFCLSCFPLMNFLLYFATSPHLPSPSEHLRLAVVSFLNY